MIALTSAEAARSPWVEQERRAFPGLKIELPATEGARPKQDLWDALARAGIGPCGDDQELPAYQREAKASRSSLLAEAQLRTAALDERCTSVSSAPKLGAQEWVNPVDGAEFIAIEAPAMRSGWMSRSPVTNAQYAQFLDETRQAPPPTWSKPEFCSSQQPVTGVTWFEAASYCAWCAGRLPTEGEWEAAARRGGAGDYATAAGSIAPDLAKYGGEFGSGWPDAVGAYPASSGGFYDLCGNVWEWCSTSWGEHRVIKGGSFLDSAEFCAISARYRNSPIDRDCSVGFRVWLDA
jgi:hypothetical protein